MKRVFIFAVVAATALEAGCASAGSLRSEPLGGGVSRQYDAPLGKMVGWAREAIVEAGLAIEEASQPAENTWMIIGQKDASAWSWGELVRVVLVEDEPGVTTVRIITARRMSTNVTADNDHSESIFSGLALRVAAGSDSEESP